MSYANDSQAADSFSVEQPKKICVKVDQLLPF